MKKLLIRLLPIIPLFSLIMGTGLTCDLTVKPVQAAGSTVLDISAYHTGNWQTTTQDTFPNIHAGIPAFTTQTDSVLTVGVYSTTTADKFGDIASVLTFDNSGILAGSEIVDVTLYLKVSVVGSGSGGSYPMYFRAWTGNPTQESSFTSSDEVDYHPPGNLDWGSLSQPIDYYDCEVDEWIGLNCNYNASSEGGYTWLTEDYNGDGDQYVAIYIVDNYNSYAYGPTWMANHQSAVSFYRPDDATPANRPYLEVTYAEPAADRVPDDESNGDPYSGEVDADWTAENVTWRTPRAAWADDTSAGGYMSYFGIEGDPGIDLALSYVDSAGNVLETSTGQTDENGSWYWGVQSPGETARWVRCICNWSNSSGNTSGTIMSTWGRVMPSPMPSMRLLETYSTATNWPQYDNSFSSYVVYTDGIMWIFWKTNLEDADLSDYRLQLIAAGQTVVWSENFTWLNEYVYQTDNPNNDYLAHWRYMAISPRIQTGIDTHDGFIQNAGKNYVLNTTGFWDIRVAASDNTPITWCHSAYYYLNSVAQGVAITLDKSQYDVGGTISATIDIGDHSRVGDYLGDLEMIVIDSTGAIISDTTGFVQNGENVREIPVPVDTGDYQIRFRFSGDLVADYEYIHDVTFAAGESEIVEGEPPNADDALGFIDQILENYGLNNALGHWLLLIICIILVTAIFGVYGKMPLAATVIDVILFALWIYIGWVDVWAIALVALGVGLTLYGYLRKRTSGGGSSAES